MSEPKNDPNPDELQPVTLSDEDTERMIENYAAMEELKRFNPELADWEVMKKKDFKVEGKPEQQINDESDV